jgi:hypothetical protein
MSLRTSVILASQAVAPLAFTAPSAFVGGTRVLLLAGGGVALTVAAAGTIFRR